MFDRQQQEAAQATFGVTLSRDGVVTDIREGSFDAGDAEAIACRLILLAAAIRASARRRIFLDANA